MQTRESSQILFKIRAQAFGEEGLMQHSRVNADFNFKSLKENLISGQATGTT